MPGFEEDFRRAYVGCMLWAELAEDGLPLDASYSAADLSIEAGAKVSADCAAFVKAAGTLLDAMTADEAGHDFWLTRQHHGAGFWDRGLGAVGAKLTQLSHMFGSCDPYIGDDGLIHFHVEKVKR